MTSCGLELGHLPSPFLNLVEKLIRANGELGKIIQLDVIERLASQERIFSGKKN